MSEPESVLHKIVGHCDDILELAKDVAIILLVVLFLFDGPYLRTKLDAVGISEIGPIKLAEVEKSNQQAKAAASSVDGLQQKITDLESKLAEVSAHDPGAEKAISPLRSEIAALKSQASSADQSLKISLLSQQEILRKAAPQSVESAGWIYAGQVDESKTSWAGVGSKNISPAPASPEFHAGQTFSIASDAYLRNSSPSSGTWHTQGEIVGVLKQGDQVQVEDVDTSSHAKSGGWFVWLKVKRPS